MTTTSPPIDRTPIEHVPYASPSKQKCYAYLHRPGHGGSDHMAAMVIGIAHKNLGLDADVDAKFPARRGVKRRLRAALRAAEDLIAHGGYFDALICIETIPPSARATS